MDSRHACAAGGGVSALRRGGQAGDAAAAGPLEAANSSPGAVPPRTIQSSLECSALRFSKGPSACGTAPGRAIPCLPLSLAAWYRTDHQALPRGTGLSHLPDPRPALPASAPPCPAPQPGPARTDRAGPGLVRLGRDGPGRSGLGLVGPGLVGLGRTWSVWPWSARADQCVA